VTGLVTETTGEGQRLIDVKVSDVDELGPEGGGDSRAFRTHTLGHDDQHLVALDRRHHAHGVARVATGRFDDRVARQQQSFALGPFNDVAGHPGLDRAGGIEVLEF
jgi:hypothetical protein